MTHDHKSPQDASSTRLDEIQARANAATPGPWECMGETVFGTYSYIRKCKSHWPITETARNKDHEKNGMFIAHAREDIPWLISELRSAQQEVRRLQMDQASQRFWIGYAAGLEIRFDLPENDRIAVKRMLGEDK